MISVICIYNDKAILDGMLLASLQRQDVGCQLVCIDNTDSRYSCAATVLNEAGAAAENDLVMFVHQDIEFLSTTWLSEAERMLRALESGAAAGVAGVDESGVMSASVWHGEPWHFAGGMPVDVPTPVQTLDGSLLIAARADFRRTRFDAKVCPGWYLYVAEYCLSRKKLGFRAFVLPLPVYHRSTGPADVSSVNATAKAIIAKHRTHSPRIFSTLGELTQAPSNDG